MTSVGHLRQSTYTPAFVNERQPQHSKGATPVLASALFSEDSLDFPESAQSSGDLIYALEFIDEPEPIEIRKNIPLISRITLDWLKPFL